MKTLEKFNRRIIELIHGMSYEEAVRKEQAGKLQMAREKKPLRLEDTACDYAYNSGARAQYLLSVTASFPVTIGRVLQALRNIEIEEWSLLTNGVLLIMPTLEPLEPAIKWQLTKENGADTTSADIWEKSPETIEKLYKLIK